MSGLKHKPLWALLSLLVGCAPAAPSLTTARPSASPTPLPSGTGAILLLPSPETSATPTPTPSIAPAPEMSPSLPSTQPGDSATALASLHFPVSTYFLNAAGERAQLTVQARNAQGQTIPLPGGLVWASEDPEHFDLDQQGQVTARVSTGQVRLSVRHLSSGIRAEVLLIMRASTGGSGNASGPAPSPPPLRDCETQQGCLPVSGTGTSGFLGDFGPAVEADLDAPHGLVFANGRLYIADAFNHRVRYTENELLFPLAGMGVMGFSESDPRAVAQQLNFPQSVALHDQSLYISDKVNNRVRAVNLLNGEMHTVAGGGEQGDDVPATETALSFPMGLVRAGQRLYIADALHHRIRQVDLSTGLITTVAGSLGLGDTGDGGPAVNARLHTPHGIAIQNQTLYIADTLNHKIRAVDLSTGIIQTLAGTGESGYSGDGGLATQARLNYPTEMAYSTQGHLYIVDSQNQVVRMLHGQSGRIYTVAKGFALPYGIALNPQGKLYVSDTQTHQIYEITP